MKTSLIKTRRADWYQCIIPSTLIFFSALLVTAGDFFHIQKMIYHLDAVNVIGLILFGAGIVIRRVGARANLGEILFIWFENLATSQDN